MKKLTAILLIMLLCAGFAACGGSSDAPADSGTDDAAPATQDSADDPGAESALAFDWNTQADKYANAYAGMTDSDEPVLFLSSAAGDLGVFAMLDSTKGQTVRYAGAMSADGTITDAQTGETLRVTLSDGSDGTRTLDCSLVTVTVAACAPAEVFDQLNALGIEG